MSDSSSLNSSRFDQSSEISSSSSSEDTEHANLFHRFDSIKPLIDKLYGEVTHGGDKNSKCLQEKNFIVKNEGRGRRRFKLSAIVVPVYNIKLSMNRVT
jgi:hypothetical protein